MASTTEQARQLLIGDGTKPLKLEYFAIEGVAEQVRIALTLAEVPFDDVRIPFPEWAAKKPTTQHGVLPEMTLPSGEVVTDSLAMLRLAGEADPKEKLYPKDVASRCKVDQAIGLVGDLARAFQPGLYLGMRHQQYGYPENWAEKEAVVKKVREGFVAEKLPLYMGYFSNLIKENGSKFLLGDDITIADFAAYQQIAYFKKGIADHIPKDCLEPYTEVTSWLSRVESEPRFAAYKASKA